MSEEVLAQSIKGRQMQLPKTSTTKLSTDCPTNLSTNPAVSSSGAASEWR